jgi:putrescine importer
MCTMLRSVGVETQPHLRRTLTLGDLLLYGIVLISPTSPMTVFGILSDRGHGHVVTAILIALVAMLFTGISYGRMASAYPSAGSAFTYVAREVNPGIGYITGWAMVMDYIVNPVTGTIWCAEQLHEFVGTVPVVAWKVVFATLFTVLNIRGIKSSARISKGMAAIQGAVVIAILVASACYILRQPHNAPAFFTRPFYDAQTFSFGGLFGSASIAVLAYMGFDGISTLSEETKNPRRNILLATVLTCLLIGIVSAFEVYMAQLVWPASERFPNVDTAYVWMAARVWRPFLSIVGVTLLIAAVGAGTGAHLCAARLLYGMGRSNALPAKFFGAIDAKHSIPRNNVLFVGAAVMLVSLLLTFGLAVEMLNYGALIAFMGVNLAAFLRYFWRAQRKTVGNFLPPVLGFLICMWLWWNLSSPAKWLGSIWIIIGVAFGVWRTRGFRVKLSFDRADD